MSRRCFYVTAAIIVVAAVPSIFLRSAGIRKNGADKKAPGSTPTAVGPQTPSVPTSTPGRGALAAAARDAAVWQRLLDTTFDFYGKVIDENRGPVAAATVRYWVTKKIGGGNPPQEMHSGPDGLFYIRRARGLGVTVEVSKPGYYKIKESRGSFGYASGSGGDRRLPSSREPALFVLKKAGEPQQLFEFRRFVMLPKNGTPVFVRLTDGQISGEQPSSDSLQCQSWVTDESRNDREEFQWRVRLTVPDGGLIERSGEFDFQAPSNGYNTSVDLQMQSWVGGAWQRGVAKQFFVALPDGRYARIRIDYVAGGHNRLSIASWYNPSGSTNLESGTEEPNNVLNHP